MKIEELVILLSPEWWEDTKTGDKSFLYFNHKAETRIIAGHETEYEDGEVSYPPGNDLRSIEFNNKYRMVRHFSIWWRYHEKGEMPDFQKILKEYEKIKGWNDMLPWKVERVKKRGRPKVSSIRCIAGRLLCGWQAYTTRTLKWMHDYDVVIRTGTYRQEYGKDSISKVLEQLILYRYIERISLGLYERTAKRLK